MNYDRELLNKLQLFNSCHKNKANEIIIGIDAYRYFKRQIKNNNNPDFYKAKFDDRGILREILGMTIKIDYMIPYIIEIRHNPYLKSSVDYIWLSEEEMKNNYSKYCDYSILYIYKWRKIIFINIMARLY